MSLSEEYASNLNNLLYTLRAMKASGMVDGIPTMMLFNFARSEINGLAKGSQTKDECKGCADCCIKPPAIVPLQGMDGGVIRPLKYGLKYQRQPCWWLRETPEGFKCAIHNSGEKPFTCYSFLCESREKLEENISNSEKEGK